MVDYREVSRTVHQLVLDHGVSAHLYASRLANEAEAEGMTDEAAFWSAVAASVAPRIPN